jgi:hypothetical protein
MSALVVPPGWPSPAVLTARNGVTERDPVSAWTTWRLSEMWGEVAFDVGVRLDHARVAWVDGPSLAELSTHLRSFCRSSRLDLRRNPSLSAMVWCAKMARTNGDGLVGTARRLFSDHGIHPGSVHEDWERLRRVGQVAAGRNRNQRPTWGEILVAERLLDGAHDSVVDAATVLSGETELTLRELIQLAHRL